MRTILLASALFLATAYARAEMTAETLAKYGGADHMVMVSTYARASVTAVLCNLRPEAWGTQLRGAIERQISADSSLTGAQRGNLLLLLAVSMADAKQEWRKDAGPACADVKDDLADAERFIARGN